MEETLISIKRCCKLCNKEIDVYESSTTIDMICHSCGYFYFKDVIGGIETIEEGQKHSLIHD
ncbi:hypothetical protein Q73_06705 [Bacillus coahuilensis m2-6]|uniref:Uncharacterized protein n=1 Tax=Bacillus coahuilensis p1.1.43 TaxID=1150625 RepID=A0A147K957_9BACI|nr:hypothetical protein [Bacillus coahuilensis]KUP06863.1 hypothetical protein Q75_07225 [Bacillus coahuilensis p1.1.43]KUP08299.1 hypothetical protein Q73_06705 [Bacillus coahuilensis m2-6]